MGDGRDAVGEDGRAMLSLASAEGYALARAQAESRVLAATHGPQVFAERVGAVVTKLS